MGFRPGPSETAPVSGPVLLGFELPLFWGHERRRNWLPLLPWKAPRFLCLGRSRNGVFQLLNRGRMFSWQGGHR